MSLTGTIKPTFLYPRIKYGSPVVTFDNAEPTSRIPTLTPYMGLRGVNTVASGKREYLFGRAEEQVGLVLRCEQDQLAALRWFVQDYGSTGAQFQTWVDRYTGSCWTFENTLKDQNGLAVTLNGASTPTYGISLFTEHIGILLITSYLTVPLAQASAATATGYDDPLDKDAGVIVIDFAPTFAGSDSTQHQILDTGPTTNNRLFIRKHSSNLLQFNIDSNATVSKTISATAIWSANDRVQIVVSWDAGTLAGWYAVNAGAWVALSTASGAGTGILTTLPTTLFIGADQTGANFARGSYDTVAIFKRAFTNPQLTLANFRPVERNYFPYAELTAAAFQPVRVTLGRPIWDWALTVRNGVS